MFFSCLFGKYTPCFIAQKERTEKTAFIHHGPPASAQKSPPLGGWPSFFIMKGGAIFHAARHIGTFLSRPQPDNGLEFAVSGA
jgi:hypothetical protein